MTNIVDFLHARLDEDEQAARDASGVVGGADWVVRNVPYEGIAFFSDHDGVVGHRNATTMHAELHSPSRVLREVDAKRRIIELAGAISCSGAEFAEQDYQTLTRSLAAVYSDHPDYQADWAP